MVSLIFTVKWSTNVEVMESSESLGKKLNQSLSDVMRANYELIAQSDIQNSLQDIAVIERIAMRDIAAIGEVVNFRILEIGPGHGVLLRKLRSQGANVFAADLVETYLSQLSDCVEEAAVFDIQDIDSPPNHWRGFFDLIILTDVLEHLTHPQDALLVCGTLLKEEGRIYVRVPAHESLIKYSRILGCPYSLAHLRTYDKTQLQREMISAGFRCLKGPKSSPGSSRQPGRFLGRSENYARLVRNELITNQRDRQCSGAFSEVDSSASNLKASFLGALLSKLRLSNLYSRCVNHLRSKRGEVWCLAEVADFREFSRLYQIQS
jgi:2-polyprenyl-3-methyl-5-hydroxy-6-metoxy-1,4-benzoquinol methylase